MNNMKHRYRLTCRVSRGGMFYCVDKTIGKRSSLETNNPDEAQQTSRPRTKPNASPSCSRAYSVGCAALRIPTAQKRKATTSLTVFTFLCTVFPD